MSVSANLRYYQSKSDKLQLENEILKQRLNTIKACMQIKMADYRYQREFQQRRLRTNY